METTRKCTKCRKRGEQLKVNLPIIWVIGGPGSGKGTQCDKIVAKYGFEHISSGDLIRAESQKPSGRTSALDATMAAGKLVSTDYVLELIEKELHRSAGTAKGFLIDGYPREREQGILFENRIGPVNIILFFDASEEVLTQRLLLRGKDSGRVDDNEDTIKKRMATYTEMRDSIMTEYKSKIKVINADRPPDEIFKDVQLYLDPLVK